MLSRLERCQGTAVARGEDEGGDIVAFRDLFDEAQRTDRVGIRIPTQSYGGRQVNDLLDVEGHQTTCTRKLVEFA